MLGAAGYVRHRHKMAERSRQRSEVGRDIGELPPVVDAARRERCRQSLLLFCRTYLPTLFPLPFSPKHLRLISILQAAILEGGRVAYALPRGFGKTTLARAAALWAIAYGHHRYVVIVAATKNDAAKIIRSTKVLIETSVPLNEDFPEICYPIQQLKNITQRAPGQLYKGRPTRLAWKNDTITLADIPGSPSAGCTIETVGITGAIRGRQQQLPSGEILRPTLVLIDDPQTRASAKSEQQTTDRLAIIADDIMGLAGPGVDLACVLTCTVIYPDDLSDQILDPERHREWVSERAGIVDQLPPNGELLEHYAELWRLDLGEGRRDHPNATAFWRKKKKALEKDCHPTWPERFNQGREISAVQHAVNKWLKNPVGFWAEDMNQPEKAQSGASIAASRATVAGRGVGLARGIVPAEATVLTAFIDVHLRALYWAVCAWRQDLTGWVLDYGTWPDQKRGNFTLATLPKTIANQYPGLTDLAAAHKAIDDCTTFLLSREWQRDDDVLSAHVDVCLIDSGWNSDLVYQICKRSPLAPRLIPSKGEPLGPAKKPFAAWRRDPGDRVGLWYHWSRPVKRQSRLLHLDTYQAKSHLHRALSVDERQPGAIVLYKGDARHHDLFAQHIAAERPKEKSDNGRSVVLWNLPPDRPDNHWLDCLVGCQVAASFKGCSPTIGAAPPAAQNRPGPRRNRVAYLEV